MSKACLRVRSAGSADGFCALKKAGVNMRNKNNRWIIRWWNLRYRCRDKYSPIAVTGPSGDNYLLTLLSVRFRIQARFGSCLRNQSISEKQIGTATTHRSNSRRHARVPPFLVARMFCSANRNHSLATSGVLPTWLRNPLVRRFSGGKRTFHRESLFRARPIGFKEAGE